jgi:DNA-binding transcriptional MerR regulator
MIKNEVEFDAPALSIGAMAKALGVHQRTLRIYDAQGILTPKRSELNRRLYSMEDVERGKFVLFLTKNLAINLMGVKIILKLLESTKIKPKLYVDYINGLASSLNIDKSVQEENIAKLSKRGRRIS